MVFSGTTVPGELAISSQPPGQLGGERPTCLLAALTSSTVFPVLLFVMGPLCGTLADLGKAVHEPLTAFFYIQMENWENDGTAHPAGNVDRSGSLL